MRIEIPWRWMVLGLFALCEGAMLVGYHFENDRNRATIVFAATVIGGAFALYTYLQGIEERRSQNAQSLIERWNSPDMVAVRKTLREITENRLDTVSLMRRAKGDITDDEDGKRANLVTVLNFYEELAIVALRKSANENRLYEFFSGIIELSASRLEEWIRHERKIDNQPQYYCEFLKLAKRWENRR